MADYGIDINVNMGSAGGNFQTLVDSINNLNANFQKIGTAGEDAANKHKQSFADSMVVMERYGNSIKKVDGEIKAIRNSIKLQAEEFAKGRTAPDDYRKNIEVLNAKLKELQTAQRQYNQVLGQTSTHARTASLGLNTLTTAFNKLGAVLGVSFGLYGVFRVLTSIVKTIADFDLAQKKLQSVLGETAAGMKELTQSAIDLGKSSIFGAKGISELQIELAKMGFTKNEIMAMQSAINDLAIATQEDLASSAEVVANIIKTYQLTATETRDVVNVMGKAFNDSALGLSNFRESIKYVAPVAKQAGLSFRETVAALELLSNAGLKGSLAGTGLNNVLKAMMDSNSKLSKQLGGTVSGWEGFTNVLQRAREEGWNMQDVFGLITQRATGAFATFMEGLPTLEEMQQKLEDVSNVMRDQMLVQLDSIAYQAKITKGVWETLVLSIDSGSGTISKGIKLTLEGLQKWMILLGGLESQISHQLVERVIDLKEALTLEGLDESTLKKLKEYEQRVRNMAELSTKMDANDIGNNMQEMNNLISASDEILSSTIVKGAKQRIEALKIEGKTYQEFEASRNSAILSIGFEMDELDKGGKRNTIQFKVLKEALEQIEKLRFAREDTKALEENTKAIKAKGDAEIELLRLTMKLNAEKIKLSLDGYWQEALLAENTFKYEKLILEKELELAIELGGDKIALQKKFNLESEILAAEHANKIVKITEGIDKESDALVESILKTNSSETDKIVEDWVKDIIDKIQEDVKKNIEFDKWAKENPIVNALFGKGLRDQLLSGALEMEGVEAVSEAFDLAAENISESLTDYADAWVEQTDRVVEQLNRQVDETQAALDAEIELMTEGYANNVTLKRKELEDLKKLRKEALEDQRKAQQAQVAIETITQISSLITASAQIIEGFSTIPIIGTGLGIAAVALMLGAFAAAKAKALQTAGVNKFEEGGWIGGKRHSQGGTLIEAEHGEFMINRKSASKYKPLIEAINDDNKIELNRIYLNNMKSQIVKANVSIDDSKYLKGIYERLGSERKTVEYANGYRIEKIGNVTTRIKLSLN